MNILVGNFEPFTNTDLNECKNMLKENGMPCRLVTTNNSIGLSEVVNKYSFISECIVVDDIDEYLDRIEYYLLFHSGHTSVFESIDDIPRCIHKYFNEYSINESNLTKLKIELTKRLPNNGFEIYMDRIDRVNSLVISKDELRRNKLTDKNIKDTINKAIEKYQGLYISSEDDDVIIITKD